MSVVLCLCFTALAMLAFAGNSLLCRWALKYTTMDAASFTGIRLAAGAITLCCMVGLRTAWAGGNWMSASALFVYAAAFSFAYVALPAGPGALLLFGAVQITMVGYGLYKGERLGRWSAAGLTLALAGLVGLLLPGGVAPMPLGSAVLMLLAGAAWGVYSLRGSGPYPALVSTAGNFARTLPFALVLSLLWASTTTPDPSGVALAVASGALASGVGYALWYAALRGLRSVQAAAVQLTVPVIAALGGAWWLSESLTWAQCLSGAAVLVGVGLVLLQKFKRSHTTH